MRVRFSLDKNDSTLKIVGTGNTEAGIPCTTALEVVKGVDNYIWITHDQSQTRIPPKHRRTRSLRKINHMVSGFCGERAIFVARKISHFLQRMF